MLRCIRTLSICCGYNLCWVKIYYKMVKNNKKKMVSTIDLVKIISKLKSSDSIASLLQMVDDRAIHRLVEVFANLIHNKELQGHPLLLRKLKPLKKKMRSDAALWMKLVQNPVGNLRSKRRVLIDQAGSGFLWPILSTLLPVLISLVK